MWALRVPIFLLIVQEITHEMIQAYRHCKHNKVYQIITIENFIQIINHCMHLLVLAFDIKLSFETDQEEREGMLNSMEIMSSLGGFLMAV